MRKVQEFKPTPGMQLYAHKRAEVGENVTQLDVANAIGIRAELLSRWKNIEGYEDWLEATVAKYRLPIHTILEQVAKENLNDFRFWEALSKKYGYLGADGIIPPAALAALAPALTREQARLLLKAELEKLEPKPAQEPSKEVFKESPPPEEPKPDECRDR